MKDLDDQLYYRLTTQKLIGRALVLSVIIFAVTMVAPPTVAPALPFPSPVATALSDSESEVRSADARFWEAFNHCDAAAMAALFTEDAEFYHDRTGLRSGAGVARSMIEGPCAHPTEKRLRRVPIVETVRYFPLAGGFAILEGEHRFMVSVKDRPDTHDSVARFSEVWERSPAVAPRQPGTWRMRRVLSFDHRPDTPVLASVPLSPAQRRVYAGEYRSSDGTKMTVRLVAGELHLQSGEADFSLVPLGQDRFGTPGRWLTFQIVGKLLTVVEEGRVVATAQRTTPL